MTNKILTFLAIVLLLSSCLKQREPIPPRLYVEPEQSPVDISLIEPVTFTIHGKSDEDMKRFRILTDPFIYQFDTTFPGFVHEFFYTATIKLPEQIEPFPQDSLIEVQFVLEDYYNKVIVTRQLRIRDAYPDLRIDTVTLNFPDGDFFYNVLNGQTMDTSAQPGSFDMVFAYSNDQGITIASPDAFWLENVCAQNLIQYSTAEQRHTLLNFSQVEFDDIDDRFVYDLQVNPNYIDGNQAFGIGVTGLSIGSVFVFKIENGNKGAAKLIEASAHSITMIVKSQVRVQRDKR